MTTPAPQPAPVYGPWHLNRILLVVATALFVIGAFAAGGHPLADVTEALGRTGAVPIRDLRNFEDDSMVKIAGLVTAVRRTLTKAQAQMLLATIEAPEARYTIEVFPMLCILAGAACASRTTNRTASRTPATSG